MNKYYVYDEDHYVLRWFYTKAEALLFKGNNKDWTIEFRKTPKIDLYALCGPAPF